SISVSNLSPCAPSNALSLHDALPISADGGYYFRLFRADSHCHCYCDIYRVVFLCFTGQCRTCARSRNIRAGYCLSVCAWACNTRSEEHTSELQSRFDLVCRLLLEKKK